MTAKRLTKDVRQTEDVQLLKSGVHKMKRFALRKFVHKIALVTFHWKKKTTEKQENRKTKIKLREAYIETENRKQKNKQSMDEEAIGTKSIHFEELPNESLNQNSLPHRLKK